LVTVVAAGLLALALFLGRDALGGRVYLDRNVYNWNVWYCGAEAVAEHRDPYRVEPLRTCEHRVRGASFEQPWAVIPMPLPGYSLALLWPLLALPFLAGKAVWIAIVLAALGLSAWCTARLTGLWFPAVLLIFAPAIGVLNLTYGGLEPIGIAALCAAALALERGRPGLCGALCVAAMIEPHVGLPAVAAVFVLVPRSRLAIVLGAAVLGGLTVALLGWAGVIEYVWGVLPEQSAGEALISVSQYGLTHVLHVAGVAARIATTLGSLWYLGAIALGVAAAARICARFGRSGAIVLVPVAVSLFGGLYVHNHQITAALPGALLLATLPLQRRWLALAAVALLAFPWEFVTRWQEGVACIAVAASILVLAPELALPRRLVVAGVAPILLLLAWLFVDGLPHNTFALVAHPESIGVNDLATSAWTKFLLWVPGRSVDDAATLLLKLPWWLALFALTLLSALVLRSPANAPDRSPATGT